MSRPGSHIRAGPGSRKDFGYRAVGGDADVDETLFGNKSNRSTASAGPAPVVVSTSYIRALHARVEPAPRKGESTGASGTTTTSSARRFAAKSTSARERLNRMRDADERKRAMEEAHTEAPLEEVEREMAHEWSTNPALAEAKERFAEDEDEIIGLRFKMTLARNLREKEVQIAEKRRKAAQEKKFDAFHHKRMEAQRKQEEEAWQSELARRKEVDKAGAAELHAQLAERERERVLDDERKILEGQRMLAQIAADEEKARIKAARKVEEGRLRMAELRVANAAALKIKEAKARQEAIAERRAMKFLMQKAEAEQARLDALDAEKAARDAIFQKQLAAQEKVMDQRGEEDEKKARRHEEAKVLAERARVQAEEDHKAMMLDIMYREREQQLRLKAVAAEKEKVRDAKLIRMKMREDKKAQEDALTELAAAAEARKANQEVVREQMRVRAEARDKEKRYKYKAREAIVHENARRDVKLRLVTDNKIAQLRGEGISDAHLKAAGII